MTKAQPALADIDVVFAALAHEVRRHLVLLLGHSGGELPSGYLAKRFHHSWPTTTRHLRVLENAGIVEVRRKGRSGFYRLNRERIRHVIESWLANLESPSSRQKWTSSGPKTVRELSANHAKGK